jgi:hypothetical protein
MILHTIFDRFFARDREREARALGEIELAEAYRLYGQNRLIAIVGFAFTLVLIGFSVAQLLFNYGHPMPWWVLVIFLAVFIGAMAYSWRAWHWARHRADRP